MQSSNITNINSTDTFFERETTLPYQELETERIKALETLVKEYKL